jgi:hypothetical protein
MIQNKIKIDISIDEKSSAHYSSVEFGDFNVVGESFCSFFWTKLNDTEFKSGLFVKHTSTW